MAAGEARRSQDPERTVRIWEAGGLMVLAHWDDYLDVLVIVGQDLGPPGAAEGVTEYEYALAISPKQVPALLRALDAPLDADVLAVLEQRGADLVRTGESRWLERHGVRFEFSARYA